jgi:integrase
VTKQFGRLATGIGFAGFRLHDLRHTHATLLLLAGVPINAVAGRLGHSSPVTTMTVYAHVLRRAEDRAAEVAGGLLRAALLD